MKDYCGFRFGNIHSDDLHLTVVSSGSRYNKNLLPSPTDYSDDIPGADGKYYYGQVYSTREFTINVAFDSIDEPTWRRISQVFSTDKLRDLVFDENPYKVYRAKLRSAPDFKFVAFTDRKTGQRIYKGEGSFSFICYHPYAFCFNKYIVRAADYYKCLTPEQIINKDDAERNNYNRLTPPKMMNGTIKDHYNVRPNMQTPWKGGYPTIEQVQNGELFFTPEKKDKPSANALIGDCTTGAATTRGTISEPKKLIIDVRGYWDNIPKWQCAAKLLTTPTLDYDQELIYAPQYSKKNYYNMDTGLNKQNGLIGSRILVYNPGDIPVDFELRLGNLINDFRKNGRDLGTPYRFRVSRYNVQRLNIELAVDWTGLKTYDISKNTDYKYGQKYVTIADKPAEGTYIPTYIDLKNAHPKHMYLVEPIPREKLGHFIRLFYWQSLQNATDDTVVAAREDWEQAKEMANRYEELYEQCITEDEYYELYWATLKELFKGYEGNFTDAMKQEMTFEQFYYNYIYNPPEYIRKRPGYDDVYYGEFEFNKQHIPTYYTYDYIEMTSEGFDKIKADDRTLPLYLDFSERLLYNINEPEKSDENVHSYYDFKPTKQIFNDNIKEGHWFKLPPGWSMIDVSPVVDEDIWGGKRWLDARPFTWGKETENDRKLYDNIYLAAAREYVHQTKRELGKNINELDVNKIEDLIQFRKWYTNPGKPNSTQSPFAYELYKTQIEWAEYGFLKTLCDFWRAYHKDATTGEYSKDIDSFWWLANHYSWVNFPPLYWGYADLLNKLQIKYVPQYY